MICPRCGRRTYKDESVCPKCGAEMSSRTIPVPGTTRVQVKRPETTYTADYAPTPVHNTEYIPQPEPEVPSVHEQYAPPVQYTAPTPVQYTAPMPAPKPVPEPKPAPAPAPIPVHEPVQEKEDLDRTLTFAAIRESANTETAAVREYNRMKAQLRESKSADDASKVVLERLPEGYVYVKMSIDDADRLSKRKNIPKPLVLAVSGAAVITLFLIILLIIITGGGKSKPPIIGRWQGEIEPLRFGITGIPYTSVDTVWEFGEGGDVKIMPQESLLAGYDLIGTYKLSEDGSSTIVQLDLDCYGEKINVEVIYVIDKDSNTMTISNKAQPSYTYSFNKLD